MHRAIPCSQQKSSQQKSSSQPARICENEEILKYSDESLNQLKLTPPSLFQVCNLEDDVEGLFDVMSIVKFQASKRRYSRSQDDNLNATHLPLLFEDTHRPRDYAKRLSRFQMGLINMIETLHCCKQQAANESKSG